jgi:hypothetical protein
MCRLGNRQAVTLAGTGGRHCGQLAGDVVITVGAREILGTVLPKTCELEGFA